MKKSYSDLTIIIPALGECENLRKLLPVLTAKYDGASIIVSDDRPDDCTKRLIPRVRGARLLDRSKRSVHGLCASVLDAALQARTDKIVVMDGDMQHPPDKVGRISDSLDKNDIVVGVRTKIENWGLGRRVISKGMASIAYYWFLFTGKRTTNDIMSGFFGIRSGIFKGLIKESRGSYVEGGYKVLLDTLRVVGRDARIGEVGYSTFHPREFGKSKFNFKQVKNTLRSTFR